MGLVRKGGKLADSLLTGEMGMLDFRAFPCAMLDTLRHELAVMHSSVPGVTVL